MNTKFRPGSVGLSIVACAAGLALVAAGGGRILKAAASNNASDAHGAAAASNDAHANAGPLQFKDGDHIAILGNTLPDRMQHDGWLQTLIYARFPRQNLVFRNISRAGDEVATWHRSENFGTRDEWLTKTKADVIFAFYGFNESFAGPAGVATFKANLDAFLKHAASQNYSGKGAPRVVLFSPIANEKLSDPNYPDPAANNANIKAYAAAMAEVAKANGVEFVDLYEPSQTLYAQAARAGKSLTINTLHLTPEGDRELAPIIFRSLFDETPPNGDFEKLRAAIVDKDEQWHHRYRTVDGYNVYGGRSAEAYRPGQGGQITNRFAPPPYVSNYRIMQEEMSQRDVLTGNRDRRIWAVAQGQDLVLKDNDLPPVEKVKTNHPGPNPDGSWPYLSGEEAISKMTVPPGCKVNLFASEEQFPELVKPVQMAWDTKGRLWVSVWHNYPERTPTSKIGDSILIFEDTKGTGHADKCTHFIDNLNCPTGFQFYKDGILLMQAPDLWFVRDSHGGDHADSIQRVLMGMDSADSHHTTNSMVLDPGGGTYLSDGVFHRTQVETAAGPVRNEDACIYRFEPSTGKFERYVPYGFANPHGRVFDYWGNDLITDATGNNTYFAPAFSGHLDYPAKHPGMKEFWNRPSRPCPGTGILTSKQFPPEFWNNFLNCNVISFQGIYRVKVSEDGSGLKGETIHDSLVSSSDPNFRPTAVNVGPDGAVYFADWSNDIIGHLQHHLRDPNRDHVHGRIYRMIYASRPLEPRRAIAGQPISALLELLKEPEDQVRTLAKIELGKHDAKEVIAAVDHWITTLDPNDPAYQHHLTEALWVHQWQNVVDASLLKRMLRSPDAHARAAATRVLCYWRDRVPNALDLLKPQAEDSSPRVRLEAVRAASFFRDPEAANIALLSLKQPSDYYLNYTLHETMRQLEPWWRKAIAAGKPIAADNPAGIDYLVGSVSTAELLKLPQTPGILQAILTRPDVPDATRLAALVALAQQHKTGTAALLLQDLVLELKAPAGEPSATAMSRLLPMQPPAELAKLRDPIAALAEHGGSPDLRRSAWAAIVAADGSFDRAWKQAKASPSALTDLLGAVPLVLDPDLRNTLQPKVRELLGQKLPPDVSATIKTTPGIEGRFVRIELPRRGTLTLAEVQVFSGGRNIALGGKARQSSIAYGGEPSRAIDGRTDGDYASGTETHTQENERRPWWEVDLRSQQPIDSIVIWNRSENNGEYARRLEGFTLSVLDSNRRTVFQKTRNPAPAESARFVLRSDEVGDLRRAAIRAAVSMNKDPGGTFAALVNLIESNTQVADAAAGLRALPRNSWQPALAGKAVQAMIRWASAIPVPARTSEPYVQTIQMADDLAGLLPASQASDIRKDLKDLRVAVFVVTTVREQMRYDTPRLVVEAGKPFEVIFENGDMMPHNFTIVAPGSRPKVAAAAMLMRPDDLDSRGRAYIPRLPEVLAATKLLDPGQQESLHYTAPSKEGAYEYVCTFPGHWEVMWGTLIVTKDVDAYLAAHPAPPSAGPATAPMPAAHHHGG